MQEFLSATHDAAKLVDMLSRLVGRELERTYSDLDILSDMGLPMAMEDCCAQTGRQFVIVIDEWGCDFDECRAWYDGYRLEGTGGVRYEEYSPKSVVEAVTSGIFESYWTETETYEALKRYIDMDMDGLRSRVIELVGGAHVPIETRSCWCDRELRGVPAGAPLSFPRSPHMACAPFLPPQSHLTRCSPLVSPPPLPCMTRVPFVGQTGLDRMRMGGLGGASEGEARAQIAVRFKRLFGRGLRACCGRAARGRRRCVGRCLRAHARAFGRAGLADCVGSAQAEPGRAGLAPGTRCPQAPAAWRSALSRFGTDIGGAARKLPGDGR